MSSSLGGGPPGPGSRWGNGHRNEDKLGKASSSWTLGTPPGFSITEGSQHATSSGASVADSVSTPSIASTEVSSITNEDQRSHRSTHQTHKVPSSWVSRTWGSSIPEGSRQDTTTSSRVSIAESVAFPSVSGTSFSSITADSGRKQGGAPSRAAQTVNTPQASNSTLGDIQPKAILAGWFGKKHRQLLSKKDYYSWHDGGMPHQLMFTAVFVSPRTGEIFPCGRYGDEKNYSVRRDPRTNVDVIWYTKKTFAEHAAAARAYDCFIFREPGGRNETTHRISMEMPYMNPKSAPPLPTLPQAVQIKITDLHNSLLGQTHPQGQPSAASQNAIHNEFEDESRRFREEYRTTRGGPIPKDPRLKRC